MSPPPRAAAANILCIRSMMLFARGVQEEKMATDEGVSVCGCLESDGR